MNVTVHRAIVVETPREPWEPDPEPSSVMDVVLCGFLVLWAFGVLDDFGDEEADT